jgi:hypothetical protein
LVPRRSDTLHLLAQQLHALISSGHDGLRFDVGVVTRDPAKLRAILYLGLEGGLFWERARSARGFTAAVLEQHLIGRYAVAPAAPGWVQWVCITIGAEEGPDESEHAARLRAQRILGRVWRALGGSAERHPLVEQSPDGGYRVWLPLTRDETPIHLEHTWPAVVACAWVERHLVGAGLALRPGELEVYPSRGGRLYAPCGRGMAMMRATAPDDPDALGLVPWPVQAEPHIDASGDLDEFTIRSWQVVPMVCAFLEQWELQRRTVAVWLGRPDAAWELQRRTLADWLGPDAARGLLAWTDAEHWCRADEEEADVETPLGGDRDRDGCEDAGSHGRLATRPRSVYDRLVYR